MYIKKFQVFVTKLDIWGFKLWQFAKHSLLVGVFQRKRLEVDGRKKLATFQFSLNCQEMFCERPWVIYGATHIRGSSFKIAAPYFCTNWQKVRTHFLCNWTPNFDLALYIYRTGFKPFILTSQLLNYLRTIQVPKQLMSSFKPPNFDPTRYHTF